MKIEFSEEYNRSIVVVTEEDEPINTKEIKELAIKNGAIKDNPDLTKIEYLVLLPEKYRFDNQESEDFYTSAELYQTINLPTGREATIWRRTTHLD